MKLFRILLATLFPLAVAAQNNEDGSQIPFARQIATPADNIRLSRRPAPGQRLFRNATIEKKIQEVKEQLKNAPYLAWMFENCFPNTLDTTVHYTDKDGTDDTFIYTGDIHAMWLRDSGAQVWPYVQFAKEDQEIRKMIRGTILRQFRLICIDPYANAFNMGPTGSEWASDLTDMNPYLHERKYEIDSLCYPLRLAYQYWLVTGDDSIFGELWKEAHAGSPQSRRHGIRDGASAPACFIETALLYSKFGGYGAVFR